VQVSYSEGVANHTGPESCVGIREDVGVAREHDWYGRRWRNWRTSFSPSRRSSIRGPACGSPLDTQGRSRVPELGSLGTVRGALRNERPYREHMR
jgi:hypothetical protein